MRMSEDFVASSGRGLYSAVEKADDDDDREIV